MPSAKQTASTPAYFATWSLFPNDLLNVGDFTRQRRAQDFAAVFRDHHNVLDADADILFRNINSRLDGQDRSCLERSGRIAGIMNVQPHIMTKAMHEILAERLAMQVMAVSVDVIVGDLV